MGPQGPQGLAGADGAQGPIGPVGPQGPAGDGIVTYSWAGFDGANKWSTKVFNVQNADPQGSSYDKETRSFEITDTGFSTGTVSVTRQRINSEAGYLVQHQVLTFNFDTNGANTLVEIKNYESTDVSLLKDTRSLSPGFKFQHEAMGVGIPWSIASMITILDEFSGGVTTVSHGIETRTLLGIEDISVNGVGYSGCQKILEQRTAAKIGGGDRQAITWYCPNDGMVKRMVSYGDRSRLLEFDPNQSTLRFR